MTRGQRELTASLFVTCLVDQLFPQVGEATVDVLTRAGAWVSFPLGQTCCGQPAFNSGFVGEARTLARRNLSIFRHSRYVVVPSGSCTNMIRRFYPDLFAEEPDLLAEARSLAQRTFELSQFLVNVVRVTDVGASYHGRVTYHPSCHLLRELGISQEPLQLIANVKGIELVDRVGKVPCCGFGGTFAVKYPHISQAILEDKLREIADSGAETVVSCDMGCLMHIGGALSRRRSATRTMHLAQLLAQRENGEAGDP